MRIMALDVGSKRIGVALSDPLKITAQGLETFQRKTLEEDVKGLWKLIDEHEVSQLVVGLPKNMDGTEGPRAELCREFAARLQQETGLPVDSIRKEIDRIRAAKRRQQQRDFQKEAVQPEKQLQPKDWSLRYTDTRSAVAEEQLIAAILGDRELAEYTQVRLDPEQFSSSFLAKVYKLTCDRLDRDLDPDPAACMMGLEPAEVQLLTHILSKYAGLRDGTEQVKQYIETIQFQYQKRTASADDPEVLLEAIRRKQG